MTLTHRRQNANLSDGYVMLFADSDRNDGYGAHIWTLRTELGAPTQQLIEWTAEYYEIDLEEAESVLNPDDIVDTAGVWDDPQFVGDLWQAMEYGEVDEAAGYRTYDGAVVIDRESVELDYRVKGDDEL